MGLRPGTSRSETQIGADWDIHIAMSLDRESPSGCRTTVCARTPTFLCRLKGKGGKDVLVQNVYSSFKTTILRIDSSMLKTYAALLTAIAFEVVGTSALKASAEFTRPLPTLVMAVSYLAAFYLLSITLRVMPVGVAYALWSGIGIVAVSLIGYFAFKQSLDVPAIIGIGFIIAGVVILNVFSSSVGR